MEKEKKANSLNNIIKILEQNKITKTHIKKLNELYTVKEDTIVIINLLTKLENLLKNKKITFNYAQEIQKNIIKNLMVAIEESTKKIKKNENNNNSGENQKS